MTSLVIHIGLFMPFVLELNKGKERKNPTKKREIKTKTLTQNHPRSNIHECSKEL